MWNNDQEVISLAYNKDWKLARDTFVIFTYAFVL